MIKSGQIEDLSAAGFHYITAITRSQVRALLKRNVFQLGLFDENLCEIEQDGLRYILRKNPVRAEEMAQTRASKLAALRALMDKQNQYLAAHPRADAHTAWRVVAEKQGRLGLSDWVAVKVESGRLVLEVDEDYVREMAELDGCHVLKTDLPQEAADMATVHARYNDLAQVERAFRTMKTGHLEVRPVYVRNAGRTRAHVFIVMLAYLLRLKLEQAWRSLDVTVEEGLKRLSTLCALETVIGPESGYLFVPKPRDSVCELFKTLGLTPPETLPRRQGKVDTKRSRPTRRK